jgi:hypothetical protein
MEQLPTILGALILAFVLWIAKAVQEHSVALAEIKRDLTGASGDNGVVGETKALRVKAHEHATTIQGLLTHSEIVDLRLNQIDERLSA